MPDDKRVLRPVLDESELAQIAGWLDTLTEMKDKYSGEARRRIWAAITALELLEGFKEKVDAQWI